MELSAEKIKLVWFSFWSLLIYAFQWFMRTEDNLALYPSTDSWVTTKTNEVVLHTIIDLSILFPLVVILLIDMTLLFSKRKKEI